MQAFFDSSLCDGLCIINPVGSKPWLSPEGCRGPRRRLYVKNTPLFRHDHRSDILQAQTESELRRRYQPTTEVIEWST